MLGPIHSPGRRAPVPVNLAAGWHWHHASGTLLALFFSVAAALHAGEPRPRLWWCRQARPRWKWRRRWTRPSSWMPPPAGNSRRSTTPASWFPSRCSPPSRPTVCRTKRPSVWRPPFRRARVPTSRDASRSNRPDDTAKGNVGFRVEEVDDKSLGLWDGQSPVLVYNHGMITAENVPEGDARRTRSCYVHPLYGLSGEVLTDDFPRDHYHHHGIFWTWPHVKIDGQEYDLWTDRGIKQRFVEWLSREGGPVAGVIGVENGWFVGDQKVMIERVWICAYKAAGDARSIDLEFTWIPIDKPITLWGAGGKSYGGLTVRFAPPSSKDPSTVITVPSGRTTADLPDTPLAWADFTSKFDDQPTPSGAAVFVDPAHPDYPPTWLTRHYGPLCVGWPGVNPKTFQPGTPIRLNYRIWIHKTAAELARIQQAYDGYAAAMQAAWQ